MAAVVSAIRGFGTAPGGVRIRDRPKILQGSRNLPQQRFEEKLLCSGNFALLIVQIIYASFIIISKDKGLVFFQNFWSRT
jgi:hypothetical protein